MSKCSSVDEEEGKFLSGGCITVYPGWEGMCSWKKPAIEKRNSDEKMEVR